MIDGGICGCSGVPEGGWQRQLTKNSYSSFVPVYSQCRMWYRCALTCLLDKYTFSHFIPNTWSLWNFIHGIPLYVIIFTFISVVCFLKFTRFLRTFLMPSGKVFDIKLVCKKRTEFGTHLRLLGGHLLLQNHQCKLKCKNTRCCQSVGQPKSEMIN